MDKRGKNLHKNAFFFYLNGTNRHFDLRYGAGSGSLTFAGSSNSGIFQAGVYLNNINLLPEQQAWLTAIKSVLI